MAYNFKWPKSEIMSMTQKERGLWIQEIKKLIENEKKEQAKTLDRDLKAFVEKNTRKNDPFSY